MELGGKIMETNSHLLNLPGLEAWQANGRELGVWREEQDRWVPLTLTVEREEREGSNLQVSLGALFTFMEA